MSNTNPSVLVVGESRVDAGKTTIASGLLAWFGESGSAPLGFKPRAGNDYWFDHDDVIEAIDAGRLYGADSHKLATASVEPPTIEALNPVHRLWRPTPGRTGMLGERDRTAVVDRVSIDGETTFVVNGVAESDGIFPSIVRNQLDLSTAPRVESVQEYNDLMRDLHLPAFRAVGDRISESAAERPVVIESYGDIAVPLDQLDEYLALDAVITVAPSRLRVYRGDRWLRAREVASGSPREGRLEERTDRVAAMVEPVATHSVPPLPKHVRRHPERIARAYDDPFEALLGEIISVRT